MACARLLPCVGIPLPVSCSVSVPLFCVHGPQAYPHLSVFQIPQRSSQNPSAVSERGAQRPVTLCPLPGVPASDDGDTHIIGADIGLYLLYVSKSVIPSSA